VVFGFPIAAVKLVAPERLTVGERVLVVSTFAYRGDKQGVLPDITMGPKSLSRDVIHSTMTDTNNFE
jgi:hypothetical protein